MIGSSDESELSGGATIGEQSTAVTNWVSDSTPGRRSSSRRSENYTWAKSITAETYSDGTKEKVDVTGEKWSHTIVKGFAWNTTTVAGLLLDMVNAPIHITEEVSIKLDMYMGFKFVAELVGGYKLSKDFTVELELRSHRAAQEKSELNETKIELNKAMSQISKETLDVAKTVSKLQGDVTNRCATRRPRSSITTQRSR